jgi:hypothetical protein
VGEWFEKASLVEDIAWSRRCKWVMDMVRELENMLAIDRNIEPIVNSGPKSVKGRRVRRGFVFDWNRETGFVSVSQ